MTIYILPVTPAAETECIDMQNDRKGYWTENAPQNNLMFKRIL